LIGNVSEKVDPMPTSNYAVTHYNAEKHILEMLEHKQIDYLILRLSNVVGVPMSDKVKCWHLVVNDLCKQAVEQRQIKLKSTGQQLRDFVGTSELLEAIKIFLNNKKTSGIYNYGSGVAISIREIAYLIQKKCQELFKFKPKIFYGNQKEERLEFNYDISKFKNEFKDIKILEIQKSIEKVLLYCKNR
jgi:UDP-glucose 4-epimerase